MVQHALIIALSLVCFCGFSQDRRAAFFQQQAAASGGGFLPSDLANLKLWYRPESLSGVTQGALIATWPDDSGGGHDLVQSSDPAKPYKTNSVSNANSQPGVVSGPSGLADMTVSLQTVNVINQDQQTMFIVMDDPAEVFLQIWHVAGFGEDNRTYIPFFGSVYYDSTDSSGGRLTATAGATGTHVWEFYRNGVTQELVKDGTTLASTGSATGVFNDSLQTAHMFNASGNTGNYLVFEFVNYNAALSSGNRTSVRNYLKAKYGTP